MRGGLARPKDLDFIACRRSGRGKYPIRSRRSQSLHPTLVRRFTLRCPVTSATARGGHRCTSASNSTAETPIDLKMITLFIALRNIGTRAQWTSAMTPETMKSAAGIVTGYIRRSLARAEPIECESPRRYLTAMLPMPQYRYGIPAAVPACSSHAHQHMQDPSLTTSSSDE